MIFQDFSVDSYELTIFGSLIASKIQNSEGLEGLNLRVYCSNLELELQNSTLFFSALLDPSADSARIPGVISEDLASQGSFLIFLFFRFLV